MPADVKVKSNLKEVNKTLKGLTKKYFTKLGIFGKKDSRKGALSNAELGVVHEFGSHSKGIPSRSFLRMPLIEKRKQLLKSIAKQKENLEKGLLDNGIKEVFELAGIEAEAIVLKAFETGGYGKWAPLKKRKGTPLIDTGQLSRAITSKVVKGD